MIDDPLLRIFHIDTECYIIYLGKAADDYRPFLRIGNSPRLSEKGKSFISAVVVTESLTGNLLLEHENLQLPLNGETRYIGDPAEIEKLKQFLDEKDLPVEGYEYEEDEESPRKAGAFVYFYRSGNLHIVHDKRQIFNLRDRERDDGHFVSRAERIAQLIKANPLRYLARDLGAPGFIVAGKRPYFFRDGRIGTFGVTPDYIVDLGRYGIDPDLVLWLAEDRLSEGLLNRFKRATVTKKDLRVATSELRRLQSAVSLFSGAGLSCIVVHLEPGEKKVFSGFTLERRGADLVVGYPDGTGFPDVHFPAAADGDLPSFGRDTIKGIRYGGERFLPVEGVPYRIFEKDDREPAAFAQDYIFDFLREFKDCGNPAAQDYVRKIEPLCRAVLVPVGSSAASGLLEARAKTLAGAAPDELAFLLWNIRELSRLWNFRKGVTAGFKKHGARLASLLDAAPPPAGNETRLPVLGDFVRADGEWFVFYRLGGVLTPLKIAGAQKSAEAVDKLAARYDEAFHVRERERLARFLEGLTVVPPKRRKKSAPAEEPKSPLELLSSTAGEKAVPAPKEWAADTPGGPHITGGGPSAEILSAKGPKPASSAPFPRTFGARKGFGAGRYLLPLLAVAAAGGAAFLLFRSCGEKGIPSASAAGAEAPGLPGAAAPGPLSAEPSVPAGGASGVPGAAGTPPGASAAEAPAGNAAGTVLGETPSRGEGPAASAGSPVPGRPETGAPSPAAAPEIDPDSFAITILDVFHLVNEVADKNGYRPLDRPEDVRPDPNWIFPANAFTLPDGSVHTVRAGDTLWGIATAYIRASMRRQISEYGRIMAPYQPGPVPADARSRIAAAVGNLAASCRSEDLRRFFEKKAQTLTEG